LNDFAAWLIRWGARIALVLAAVLCLAFALLVSAFLLLAWGLGALWAKISGRRARAWPIPGIPGYARAGWQTVYRSGAQWMAQKTSAGQAARRAAFAGTGSGDITDVQPREIRDT